MGWELIRRIRRGLYDMPKFNPALGGKLSPDIDEVARALARRQRWKIMPEGAWAANLLGLSTQVPSKIMYLTDGPNNEVPSLAILGIVFKSFAIERFAIASVIVYLGMGWLVVFAARPLLQALTWHGIFWIALGGLFYTAGIAFYAFDRLSYFHAFWHLFVLGGSTCHYFAVLFYVAQPRT